jgi:hypothetical protein
LWRARQSCASSITPLVSEVSQARAIFFSRERIPVYKHPACAVAHKLENSAMVFCLFLKKEASGFIPRRPAWSLVIGHWSLVIRNSQLPLPPPNSL